MDNSTASLPRWKRHYIKRRSKVLEHLGGNCAVCHCTDDLEIDHIDPESKSFSVGEVITHSWAKIEPELKKCQLLCKTCHRKKSETDGSLAKMAKSFIHRAPQKRDDWGRFKRNEA